MTPLNTKLYRDLWRTKGQAIAIGVVIALGVMMQVMMTGLVLSLSQTRDAYYERYRLADVFVPVARAPERMVSRLSQIPGVAQVASRVSGTALIDIPTRPLPVSARTISLPDVGVPRVNDVYLTAGRRIESGHADEILLLDSFAAAHALGVGDEIRVTMSGARRHLRIVGTVQSPEFLYTTAPGELVPDDARFGVIWMGRSAMAAAYDMEGAFNEALLTLGRDAVLAEVLGDVDKLMGAYGGLGGYGVEDQFSNRFVSEEISGLEVSAKGVPPVFLGVAAFLLYIVISRLVQSEREEIGLMKAFGYRNGEVGSHYMKLVLIIAVGGALAGCLMGVAAGRAMVGLYTEYFKFPFLNFRLDPVSFVTGVGTSIFAASVGGLFVLRRVFALTPADAMRPPAPADYSRTGRIGAALAEWLDQPSRMVLRRLTRQPGRMLGAILGIASGMALTLSMVTLYAGFDRTLNLTFNVIDRSDATVSFAYPAGSGAIHALERLPGVTVVEPVRNVSVIMRNGLRSHKGGITGLSRNPQLSRAIDAAYRDIDLPASGVVLTKALADILQIEPGEMLTVEVREGRQPTIEIPVAAIATSLLGAPAYMDLEALDRVLGEPGRVSGAYMRIDPDQRAAIYAAIKDMPAIAGISLKSDAQQAFQTLMNTGAGATRYVMGLVAFVITFGIVYNAARVAQAERARDLASLRVIGFHTGETAFVLLGELAVVTLVALPLGGVMGHYLSYAIAEGFSTDLYQIPTLFLPASHGYAAIVVLSAALASGWLVKRDIDRADIITALKTRE